MIDRHCLNLQEILDNIELLELYYAKQNRFYNCRTVCKLKNTKYQFYDCLLQDKCRLLHTPKSPHEFFSTKKLFVLFQWAIQASQFLTEKDSQ